MTLLGLPVITKDVTELHEDRVQHLIENYKSDGYILQLASFYREWQSERPLDNKEKLCSQIVV